MGDKTAHKRKKSGRKAEKRKVAVSKKGQEGGQEAGKAAARNPKAFVFSSRGRAKQQKARSAEKDQRRLHGGHSKLLQLLAPTLV